MIVVSTVSCIYGLGTPQEYVDRMVRLRVGEEHDRDSVLRRLVEIQYTRNDLTFTRGTFRVRGDTLEIFPVYEEMAVRVEFFGDEIERLMTLHPVTGEVLTEDNELYIFPASHYVAGPQRMERAINGIEAELAEQLATFERQGKMLEAQRLRMRTAYDIEMMRQIGTCSGIENYSMHIDGRSRGLGAQLPPRLLPRGLPARHRRVPRRGARRSAGCTKATCPASATWSSTASGCRAPWTTGRCAGRSSSTGSARPSTSPRPPATTSSTRSRATSSSRSSGRPA